MPGYFAEDDNLSINPDDFGDLPIKGEGMPAGLSDVSDLRMGDGVEIDDMMDMPGLAVDVDGDGSPDMMFMLDPVPGAPNASEIVIQPEEESEEEIVISPDGSVGVDEDDVWNWQKGGPSGFIQWLKKMFDGVPQHSGYDSTGLEKAIAYFEAIDKEITKAMRQDFKNEIDSASAERAREQVENAIERLIERLEKVRMDKFKRHKKKNEKKKKSSLTEEAMIKEASRGARINGIVITVPLLISSIARVCINGMVSGGHDIEDMFEKQAKEYNLDKREKVELAQLLDDMGYFMHVDRGYPPGTPVDTTRSDNYDWGANYPG